MDGSLPSGSKEPVDDEHARVVCLMGQGAACCRYLTIGAQGWSCEKHSRMGRTLDARVAAKTMTAQGDNCEGRLCR